jgi:hypothetical protein
VFAVDPRATKRGAMEGRFLCGFALCDTSGEKPSFAWRNAPGEDLVYRDADRITYGVIPKQERFTQGQRGAFETSFA